MRQMCHHICLGQMYNKYSINIAPYLRSDKYRVKLNKFEAENSGVQITIYCCTSFPVPIKEKAN